MVSPRSPSARDREHPAGFRVVVSFEIHVQILFPCEAVDLGHGKAQTPHRDDHAQPGCRLREVRHVV